MRRVGIGAVALVAVVFLSGCNEEQQACNDMAGNGNYVPVTDGGTRYCENQFNGDRFPLE